jgi:hypothetical protein
MQISKAHIFLSLFAVLVFSFCKKTEPEQPEINNTTFDASLSLIQSYTVSGGNAVKNGRYPNIFFRAWPEHSHGPSSVYLSSVLFNSKSLHLSMPPPTYGYATTNLGDTASQTQTPPYNWVVNGGNGFPTFSETVTDSIPDFFYSNLLPDTIFKSSSTNIVLGGKYADEITIYVSSLANSSNFYYAKISSSNTIHTISNPTDLIANSNGTLSISYNKHYTKKYYNIPVDFYTGCTYYKTVYVKN